MKIHGVFSLLAALACLASSAHAQEPAEWPVRFGFIIGGDQTQGGLNTYSRAGLLFGVTGQYTPAVSHFTVRSDVTLHVFGEFGCPQRPIGNGNYACDPNALPGDMVSWSVDGVARLLGPRARWSPYILGGGALYVTSGTNGETVPSHAGLQWGAGMEFRTGKTGTLMLEWRRMLLSPGSIAPITLGFRF